MKIKIGDKHINWLLETLRMILGKTILAHSRMYGALLLPKRLLNQTSVLVVGRKRKRLDECCIILISCMILI